MFLAILYISNHAIIIILGYRVTDDEEIYLIRDRDNQITRILVFIR